MGTGNTIPKLAALDSNTLDATSQGGPGSAVFKAGLEATRDGVVICDARLPDMPLIFVNAAFERMTGYSREQILGQNCRFLQVDDHDQTGIEKIRQALKNQRDCLVTIRNYRQNGELFHNELSLSPVFGSDNQLTHYVGIQKDVTSRVAREILLRERGAELQVLNKQLQRLASIDPLTGLQNRRMFNLTLNREWRRAMRKQGVLSLYMIDIDKFKELNDSLGHAIGDACLRTFGAALTRVFCRATDYVVRFGGDEFVVLSVGISSAEAVAQGERVLRTVRDLEFAGSDLNVTASIGLCTVTAHTDVNEQDLLAAADTALYRAKNAGRNRLDSMEISTPDDAR
ncbi:MAG: diguanylate cyclase [Woeseia sp.]|nr:diguanylate cyclase [Woeseia sp.]MBT8097555.1 diguanylate cyclase [Woeseia sp.]NNE61121.1 diguanylate cyclase [Woeseia sp.]NNL55724.1 diguanylate cyclase [Woeseia sp.]